MAAHGTPQQVALRCGIVLAAATGHTSLEIGMELGVDVKTVALWRSRFAQEGAQGLRSVAAGRGRKPTYSSDKIKAIVQATLSTQPKGMTQWSCRQMAQAQREIRGCIHAPCGEACVVGWIKACGAISIFEKFMVDVGGKMIIKQVAVITLATLIAACTATTNVRPVRTKLDQVCIERNPTVELSDMLDVIEANLKRHGIKTRTFDMSPAPCQYRLTYDGSRRWDVSSFLSDAQITILEDREVIGRAEYHLPAGIFGGGGANPNKWRGTAFKIDPVMDQMLKEFHK